MLNDVDSSQDPGDVCTQSWTFGTAACVMLFCMATTKVPSLEVQCGLLFLADPSIHNLKKSLRKATCQAP